MVWPQCPFPTFHPTLSSIYPLFQPHSTVSNTMHFFLLHTLIHAVPQTGVSLFSSLHTSNSFKMSFPHEDFTSLSDWI